MLTKILFVVSLLVAAAYAQTAEDNGGVSQFINGGFTDPLSTGWTVTPAGSVVLNSGVDSHSLPNYAITSPASASFASGIVASISQELDLIESGEQLTLTFWLKVDGMGTPQNFGVQYSFNGQPMQVLFSNAAPGVDPINGFFKNVALLSAPPGSATHGTLTISFSSGMSNVVYYVDDVSITGNSFVVGDPQFVGLRGQSYQVHGVDGEIYNLVSSVSTQVNAKFVFLSSGQCPVFDGIPATNCWSHPGSYLGAIGVQQIVGGKTHRLSIVAGSAKQGFASVTLNGKSMPVGSEFSDTSVFSVSFTSTHSIQVKTEEFSFTFDNSDMFVNQAVSTRVPLSSLKSHGLFGQTHARKIYNSAVKYIAGDVDDYVVAEGDLFGKDFVYNQFEL